jgi:hypothetical protein
MNKMARDHQRIDQILQSCLDLIESGQETVDSALARYPEFADELRPVLETAFWLSSNKDTLNPRAGFVSASRKRVVARYREEMVAEATRGGRTSWRPLLVPLFNKTAAQVLFAVVLFVSLVVGATAWSWLRSLGTGFTR